MGARFGLAELVRINPILGASRGDRPIKLPLLKDKANKIVAVRAKLDGADGGSVLRAGRQAGDANDNRRI